MRAVDYQTKPNNPCCLRLFAFSSLTNLGPHYRRGPRARAASCARIASAGVMMSRGSSRLRSASCAIIAPSCVCTSERKNGDLLEVGAIANFGRRAAAHPAC